MHLKKGAYPIWKREEARKEERVAFAEAKEGNLVPFDLDIKDECSIFAFLYFYPYPILLFFFG